jgi:hypothetical protein
MERNYLAHHGGDAELAAGALLIRRMRFRLFRLLILCAVLRPLKVA